MIQRFISRNSKSNLLVILIIGVLLFTFIFFFGIKSNDEIHTIVQKQYSEQKLLISKQASSGIQEFLEEKTIIIEILAELMSDSTHGIDIGDFEMVYNETSDIYVIEFINESGVVNMGYPRQNTPLGYDIYEYERPTDDDTEYVLIDTFEWVRDRKETRITKPVELLEGGLGAFIWVPVYNGEEFKGVILAIIKISDISNRFLNNSNSPEEIYLMDNRGSVLFDSSDKYRPGYRYQVLDNSDLEQIIHDQMNGSEGTAYYLDNNESDKKLVAYSPVTWRNVNFSVAVVSPLSNVNSLIRSVYVKQGMFIGLAGGYIILGSLLIILLLSRWNRSLELEVSRKTGELKESNDLLKKANDKLIELDKLKSDFLSMVSHELKTPLTSMRISSEFMLENDPDPETRKELCEIFIRNTDRLTRMVDDLLDTSRIESNDLRFKKEMVDIRNIINTSIRTVRKQSEKKKLDITAEIPENISKIFADNDRLTQVFVNLLSNSIKFTQERGKVKIKILDYEKFIEVQVKDNGIGIPPDKLDKIFDKLYQVDNSSTRAYGGSGIGLAITKGIVEGHGGTIKVESEVGKGCLFILTFNKPEE